MTLLDELYEELYSYPFVYEDDSATEIVYEYITIVYPLVKDPDIYVTRIPIKEGPYTIGYEYYIDFNETLYRQYYPELFI